MNTAAETFAKQIELADAIRHLDTIVFGDVSGFPMAGNPAEANAKAKVEALRAEVAAMQEFVGGQVFLIPEHNVVVLDEKLDKLNKRADKLGVARVTRDLHETVEKKVDGNYHVFQYVAVKGRSPKLAGWQFAATLEHDENGVIVRRLPALDAAVDLTAYRNADPANCDQCHQRRRRIDTYVVVHEDGTLKQVGSSCLKDFLGGQSPAQIAQWLSFVADLLDDLEREDSEFYGGSAPARVGTLDFLTHVACMIRNSGWTSKGTAWERGGYPTANAADDNMFNQARRKTDRQGAPLWIDPTDDDHAVAMEALYHVRALEEGDLADDYVYNLFTSLKGESVAKRQFGIAASAIVFMRKRIEKKLTAERKAASEYIGEVGQKKFTVEVTITKVVELEPYAYGSAPGALYIMQDACGNVVKWNSSKQIDGMEQGVEGVIVGTIKAHDDGTGKYGDKNYGKSTVLTRCKFEAK